MLEAPTATAVAGECTRQHFDRDVAMEARVAREVHFAHPAGTQQECDFVRADKRSRSQTRGQAGLVVDDRIDPAWRRGARPIDGHVVGQGRCGGLGARLVDRRLRVWPVTASGKARLDLLPEMCVRTTSVRHVPAALVRR